MQAYLSIGGAVDGLITDAGVDWRAERQARFAAGNVARRARADATSRGRTRRCSRRRSTRAGANLVRGARQLRRRRLAAAAAARDGRHRASSRSARTSRRRPGSVVLRTEVFELIQYTPQTEQVREVPLLFVPPTINKYYVLDLAPGPQHGRVPGRAGPAGVRRSPGATPTTRQGHFDLDTYARAVLEARDAVAEITAQPAVHLNAACSGGIIAAGAARAPRRRPAASATIASLTLMVCALDNERAGTAARADQPRARRRRRRRVRPPRLRRRPGAGGRVHVAAAQRPGVELRRQQLPARQDAAGVRHPLLEPGHRAPRRRAAPRLHPPRARQLARARRAGCEVLGTPVDLARGRRRHLHRRRAQRPHHAVGERVPQRRSCSAATPRFVLSTSGHIQALVNPPSAGRAARATASPRSARRPGGVPRAGAESGRELVARLRRVAGRALGRAEAAPAELGSREHAGAKAPGSYVHAPS